jgi:type IX secretion system PorP/SprF family membrane protein
MKTLAANLNKTIITLLSGLSMQFASAQQQPQFTQFMYNYLVVNPAYAGAEEVLSLTLVNRSQWSGVENAPTTQSFSAHTLVKKKNIGLGITVVNDRIGVHQNTTISSSYAYHLMVGRSSAFSFGLQLGATKMKSDYASLAGNSNDPKLANSVNETLFGFGTGIYFRSPRLHMGVSVPELISKTVQLNDTLSLDIHRMNLLGNARYRISIGSRTELEPGMLVKYYTDSPLSYDINLNLIYRKVLTTGVSYRKKESIDFILKFQLTPQLELGYAYDYPVNYAARLSSASHELLIHYAFRKTHKHVTSPR